MTNNRITLLTGAGFTKNFGGLLADEMWAMIFNHKEVQGSPILRNNMLSEFNYETVYQLIIDDDKLNEQEKIAMRDALLSAYEYQENNWRQQDFFLQVEDGKINHLCDFISKYVGLYFTLNHDLLYEKILLRKFKRRNPNILANPADLGNAQNKSAIPNEKDLALKQAMINEQLSNNLSLSYIKLHGSINWLDSDKGDTLVIVGGKKKQKIEEEPLLNQYYKIFKETLSSPDQQLLVIGYGFMDNHINEVILDGINKNGLKLHIIDTLSPKAFSDKMAQSEYRKGISKEERNAMTTREMIWLNMSGYFPVRSLFDLFTVNGPTPLYGKLLENLQLK